MLKFFAADWTEIVRSIDEMSNVLGTLTLTSFIGGGESLDKLPPALSRIEELCRKLQLEFSASYAKELHDRASVTLTATDLSSADGGRVRSRRMLAARMGISGFENAEEFVREIKILRKRLDDELLNREFFVLDSDQAARFSDPHPFGEDVEAAFPSAINDIEEASKCLALERPTASAFHAMRVTELGLKALTKTLGVAYAPSWESHRKRPVIDVLPPPQPAV